MATDYTGLIPPANNKKPKFTAWVATLAGSIGQISDTALSLIGKFDVDTATGVQLDAVGRWVGVSRFQNVPTPSSSFSWDTAGAGWDEAPWADPYSASTLTVSMNDATYRAIIKAKIGANYWVGTYEAVQAIGAASSDLGVVCYVLDNHDMTTSVYITGTPSTILKQLVLKGLIPPKAAGVTLTGYYNGGTFYPAPAPIGPRAGFSFGVLQN